MAREMGQGALGERLVRKGSASCLLEVNCRLSCILVNAQMIG